VIIIGGGIIGLSLSIVLRKRGASVLVVERGEPGREASHAAGGMLVDCPLETPRPLQALATASVRLYPEFARELELESAMKVDLRDYGTVFLPTKEHISHPHWSTMNTRGFDPERAEPALRMPRFENVLEQAAYLTERSVDPRALTNAAFKTAKARGVDFSSGDPVTAVDCTESGVSGITTKKTSFKAGRVVNCAGAWSGQLGPHRFPTRPVKGQMLCLAMPSRDPLKHVIRSPQAYLIPRSDGRLLVGATVEEAPRLSSCRNSRTRKSSKTGPDYVPELPTRYRFSEQLRLVATSLRQDISAMEFCWRQLPRKSWPT